MATLDANKFFDTENVLSEIKSLKQENQIQDASIVKVVNSFAGLENALVKLDNSTESFIDVVTKDAKLRERRETTSLQKRRQDILLGQKTTKSNEPPSMPMAAGGASPSAFTASTFAAGVAAAMLPQALPGNDGGGGGGGGTATASAGVWRPLLDLIASGEAVTGNEWESLNPNTTLPGATKMTISEVANRAGDTGDGKNRAVGRYQFTSLRAQARAAGLNPDKDLFTPENQDKIAVHLIEVKRDGRSWLSGKTDDAKFSEGLALEWGALKSAQGTVLPGNSGSIGFDKIKPALEKVRKNYSGAASTPKPTGTPSATPGPQASSSMRTPVASASVPSSSKANGMDGKSKMDAPEYDASRLGIVTEPTKQDSLAMPSMASVPPSALVPSKTMEDQQAPLSMLPMTPQMTAANVITSNPLTSTNPVEDPKNLDRLMFKMSWGIVA